MSKSALGKVYFSAAKAIDAVPLSFQSINDYKGILRLGFEQLNKQGYTLHSITQLKQKHIDWLVAHWKDSRLSTGTIKNRLSVFRRIAEVSRREQVIKSNAEYATEPRAYVSEKSKAIEYIDLDKIDNDYVRASLELQKEFGLRREEAIKFKPHQADKGVAIQLQASWTKGGIPRVIPITSASQRACLDRIKAFVMKGQSLIPNDKNYREQRNIYDYTTHKSGLNNLHGLRHAYAQRRYESITNQLTNGYGWKSPIQGGPKRNLLNEYEKNVDTRARLMITQELGHSRISILRSYCH